VPAPNPNIRAEITTFSFNYTFWLNPTLHVRSYDSINRSDGLPLSEIPGVIISASSVSQAST
jgi:hypothetical protein